MRGFCISLFLRSPVQKKYAAKAGHAASRKSLPCSIIMTAVPRGSCRMAGFRRCPARTLSW